ncbi:hypothetical protein G155_00168 [Mycobacterium sp. VKM Ac-1817D]|nr:hypothetical protein G155_00168 [Mycobacterium sp. VKM Ac-1817D]
MSTDPRDTTRRKPSTGATARRARGQPEQTVRCGKHVRPPVTPFCSTADVTLPEPADGPG